MTRLTRLFTRVRVIVVILALIIIFLFIHILRQAPELSENKFVEVYVKLSWTKEIFASDTLKLREEKEKIYRQAKVTEGEMDLFLNKHNRKPEEWSRIWKNILEKLEQSRSEISSP